MTDSAKFWLVVLIAVASAALSAGVQQLRLQAERASHQATVAQIREVAASDALKETQRLAGLVSTAIESIAPLRAQQKESHEALASLLTGVRADTRSLRQQSSATSRAIAGLSHDAAKQAASACTALLAEMATTGSAMASALGQSAAAADGHYADDAEKAAGWPRSAPSQ